MKRILGALVLMVQAGAAYAAGPHGLYGLWRPGARISAVADGVTITLPWNELEPSPGVYDWSLLDAGIRVAGRRPVMIGVAPGVNTPSWVYAAGAASIAMTWSFRYGYPMCSTVRLPLPWDAAYMAAWTRFIGAFGARYNANPQVVAVKIAGINGKTIEQVLPLDPPQRCPDAVDPVPEWLAAGYRPALLQAAWAQILQAWVAAFPAKSMVLQTGPWAMPGINDQGRRTRPDWGLTTALMQQYVAAVGARAIIENDGLGATRWQWVSPLPGVPVATQAGAPVSGDASCRMAGGRPPCDPIAVVQTMLARSVDDVFVEFYPPDINNPALAGLFAARFPK